MSTSENGVVIVGTAAAPIQDVTISNAQLTLRQLTSYPGGFMDLRPGILPNRQPINDSGIYAEEVTGLTLSNVQVGGLAAEDANLPAARDTACRVSQGSHILCADAAQWGRLTSACSHPCTGSTQPDSNAACAAGLDHPCTADLGHVLCQQLGGSVPGKGVCALRPSARCASCRPAALSKPLLRRPSAFWDACQSTDAHVLHSVAPLLF